MIFIISLTLIVVYYFAQRSKSPSLLLTPKVITWNQTPTTQKDYETALKQWQAQCYFNPGNYTGDEVRKILGRCHRTLYCLDGGDIIVSYDDGETHISSRVNSKQELNFCLFYDYFANFLVDYMYFSRPGEILLNSKTYDHSPYKAAFTFVYTLQFKTYCDTLPPPTKP
ncbi:MAG: hypothetical protein Q8874_01135 [Sweet potato little leaf phytoplasma]|nr:hypothetical protein [Sweet potato little leaf phytoplasma]